MKSFKALVAEKTQMLSESGDSFQGPSFPHVLSFSVCVCAGLIPDKTKD